MGEMIKNTILLLLLVLSLGLLQAGCDLREGTIVYDVEFPRADEVDTGGSGGSGGGSSPTVNLSTSPSSFAENGGIATLTATLSTASTENTYVTLSLSGNATVSSDYTLSDNITITAGNTTGTASLTGTNDSINEGTEQIVVDILNVSGGAGATEDGDQRVTVTIDDDDLPVVSATNLAAASGENQVTVTWDNVSGADNYTIYWKTSSGVTTSDSSFTRLTGTTYIHGGLDSSLTYYYNILPYGSSFTGALTTEDSASPTAWSCPSTSGILTDNDTDLLVYYPFNGDLRDNKNTFHLTNVGGTIIFDDGCGYGLSGYFDSTSGYAENRNFRDNDSTVGSRLAAGNFTITMWINADADMPKFASAINTGFKNDMNPTGWQNKSQIDVDGKGRIEWLTKFDNGSDTEIVSSVSPPSAAALPLHKWHHIAAVHYDNDTAAFYSLGKLLGSNISFPVKWYGLVVGLNRSKNPETRLWKGYIDEVKVYGRAFTEQEVVAGCSVYAECNIPTNLTVTAGEQKNTLTWDAVSGASNYKVYRSTTPSVTTSSTFRGSPPTTTFPDSTPSLTGGTTYYYRVLSVKSSVESALSVEKNGTPTGPATTLSAAADNQSVNLTWSNVAGADNYTLYWATSSGVDNNSNSITGLSSSPYVHAGLTASTTYYYRIAAVSQSNVTGTLSNRASGTPTAFTTETLNNDNDSDLLVYYPFNGSLSDNKSKYGDSRYDLTAAGGAGFVYAASRFTGDQASYFDSQGGYAYNSSLNDDNESNLFRSGNFTISLWFYADGDMANFSSLVSSRFVPDSGRDGDNWSWQIDSDGGKIRWRSQVGDRPNSSYKTHTVSSIAYPTDEWSHLSNVKYDNGTSMVYMNGSLVATSAETQNTHLDVLKLGTNRREEFPWKGYIDELKMYSRALNATEVGYLYDNDCPKASCP